MIAFIKRMFTQRALGLAVASGLGILACDFFRLEGFMFFTPFLWIFILGGVWIVFIVAVCMALVHGVLFLKDKRPRRLYPLLACVIFFAAYWYLPIDLYRIDMLFALHKQEMQACADKIISRELRINYTTVDSMGVRLPESLAHLSHGDIVYVEKKKYRTILYFVVFSGILGNSSGFMYTSVGLPPNDCCMWGDAIPYKKYNKNWYYVVMR